MAPRRSKIELVRDLLLAVAMSPKQQEKPTRIMYAIGVSWRTIQGREANPERGWEAEEGMLDLLMRKGLLEDIGPSMTESKNSVPSRRKDRRTSSVYRITDRGLLVLRLMDLLWVYLEGDDPQVRMPPAILRILARATNFGENLEGLVQNMVYAPRLASEVADAALDNLFEDMRDDTLIIREGAPDRDRLSEALELVADENTQRLAEPPQHSMRGLTKAVNEMPAKFFVNKVIEGVEDLEAAGGQSMPVQVEATFEVVDEVTIDPSAWSETHGLKCPICGYRIYSTATERTMKKHFKVKHPNLTPVFKDA